MQCVSALPVQMTRAGYLAVLGFHSFPALTPFFLLGSGLGGCSGPAGPRLVSYPLCVMLSSHRCRCNLAVVLCPLVSLLEIVVFVVFSIIYMFLGGDFCWTTHSTILAPLLIWLHFYLFHIFDFYIRFHWKYFCSKKIIQERWLFIFPFPSI